MNRSERVAAAAVIGCDVSAYLLLMERLVAVVPDAATRLVPQVYNLEEYAPAAALGFTHIVLTLYRSPASDDAVVAFARANRPWAVTMPAGRAFSGLPRRLTAAGVPVWVHTGNSGRHLRALRAVGVGGFYSDHLLHCGGVAAADAGAEA